MILRQFPDLQWLKSQIARNFAARRGYNNQPLDNEGFPSVIINTTVKETFRPDVTGPISLFLNMQGASRCKVDSHEVEINEDFYFISNRFQPYTLSIDSKKPVETFNIHIGEKFSEGVLSAMTNPADKLLNDGPQARIPTVAFFNRLYRKDKQFNQLVQALYNHQKDESFNKMLFEEQMEALLVYLLHQHRNVLRKAEQLPAMKLSTRLELYKRLSMATDQIHSCGSANIDLDQLAASACLSKYHFLRLFRQAYGVSPYQYIQSLRMERATHLLKDASLPVQDIADALGFDNSNSFSRLFRQRTGMYPSQYRTAIN